MNTSFWKAGHAPTLFAAFLYFDLSFMVWYVLGPLGVQIASDLGLTTQQRAMMVACCVAEVPSGVCNGKLLIMTKQRTMMIKKVKIIRPIRFKTYFSMSRFPFDLKCCRKTQIWGAKVIRPPQV